MLLNETEKTLLNAKKEVEKYINPNDYASALAYMKAYQIQQRTLRRISEIENKYNFS